ncbi:Transcription factor PIF4 [Apostasia shenzhenica]|uniref:Transcription factor PIF4 n=1 Tax=Apostasia shenzhenica TaxID=1088818 RepID=A0A2I0B2G9_9ASPA|nr:Transcription factor PIF4 [Apostasia shenzhenica]
MNYFVPNSKMVDEHRLLDDLVHVTSERNSSGSDNELVELLWRNGHVVMHSQANRRGLPTIFESKQSQKPESSLKYGESIGNSSNFIQENETASWFPYPLDDSLENEFSEFFCSMVNTEHIGTEKTFKIRDKILDYNSKEENSACDKQSNIMPPPKALMVASTQHHSSLENGAVMSFSNDTKPAKANVGSENRKFCEEASESGLVVAMGESSSMRTIVSSVCGSNQVQNQAEMSNVRGTNDSLLRSAHNQLQANTFDPVVTSSSDGSGGSFGRTGQQSTTNHGQKRKRRDAEESEVHSEVL